ncbi:MAG: hypothetical protein V4667_08015 [Bacteroidota bacterium]
MKLLIILCSICIFHCEGFSNNKQQLFYKADSLFEKKEYQLAGIEYDRIAYSASTNETKVISLIKKADCYLLRNNFSVAEKCLLRIAYYDIGDSLHYAARIATATAAYLNSNFELAESQIIQIKSFVTDTSLYTNCLPLYALILNESNRWSEAQQTLLQYINSNQFISSAQKEAYANEINTIYSQKNIPKLKNVEKAKNLSTFLPGTGQLYLGYVAEGVASVAFQLVGLGFTGLCIWQKYYVTGALIGFSFFQKFYAGGITRTEFLANRKNYNMKRKFNDEAKNIILEFNQIKKAP